MQTGEVENVAWQVAWSVLIVIGASVVLGFLYHSISPVSVLNASVLAAFSLAMTLVSLLVELGEPGAFRRVLGSAVSTVGWVVVLSSTSNSRFWSIVGGLLFVAGIYVLIIGGTTPRPPGSKRWSRTMTTLGTWGTVTGVLGAPFLTLYVP